jgi:hypothetical protein
VKRTSRKARKICATTSNLYVLPFVGGYTLAFHFGWNHFSNLRRSLRGLVLFGSGCADIETGAGYRFLFGRRVK